MYTFNQFKNLANIKNLPAHEQSRQYFMYQSNILNEVVLHLEEQIAILALQQALIGIYNKKTSNNLRFFIVH